MHRRARGWWGWEVRATDYRAREVEPPTLPATRAIARATSERSMPSHPRGKSKTSSRWHAVASRVDATSRRQLCYTLFIKRTAPLCRERSLPRNSRPDGVRIGRARDWLIVPTSAVCEASLIAVSNCPAITRTLKTTTIGSSLGTRLFKDRNVPDHCLTCAWRPKLFGCATVTAALTNVQAFFGHPYNNIDHTARIPLWQRQSV